MGSWVEIVMSNVKFRVYLSRHVSGEMIGCDLARHMSGEMTMIYGGDLARCVSSQNCDSDLVRHMSSGRAL